MDSILWVSVAKHPRQAGNRTADWHRSIASPYDILCLLAEPSLLRTGISLVPHSSSPPDPSRPLQCICDGRVLSPVNKQTNGCTRFTGFAHIVQPFCHPVCPGTLILVVSVKIRQSIFCFHAAVFLVCGTVSFVLLVPS